MAYIDYVVENIGEVTTSFSAFGFNLYADGYAIDTTLPSGGADNYGFTLSSGRKGTGTIYPDVDPDTVSTIEIEYADVVWVIKDESLGIGVSNTDADASANPALTTESVLWYMDYDSFYHVRVGDTLTVYTQNDTVLLASFSGVNGDYMDWELSLEPDETGADGELIYHCGEDFKLSYYPDDHHIYIESSDELYTGEYWPN